MTRLLLGLFTVSILAGCGPADHEFPPLHPVRGVIQKGTTPVSGGQVQLQSPALGDAMLIVQGTVDDQGAFEMSTTSAKIKKKLPGAPAGSYTMIYLPLGDGQQVMPIEIPGQQAVEEKDNYWTIKLRP